MNRYTHPMGPLFRLKLLQFSCVASNHSSVSTKKTFVSTVSYLRSTFRHFFKYNGLIVFGHHSSPRPSSYFHHLLCIFLRPSFQYLLSITTLSFVIVIFSDSCIFGLNPNSDSGCGVAGFLLNQSYRVIGFCCTFPFKLESSP